MAGDWIKMRCELQTHPKIVRILSAMRLHDVQTKTDKFRVIGGLHSVWSVFDTHSVDGVLFGYTPETLDHVVGLDGFAAAMIAVEWLFYDGAETLTLPEFDEHNGQSAKRRAEDQKRKRNGRKSEGCPQSVRNLSADEAEKSPEESGLEKRREEKKEEKTYTSVPDVAFERFWEAWPNTDRKAAKAKCREKWAKSGLGVKADEIIAHITAMKAVNQSWKQGFEPAPLTYLNQRRWEDGTTTSAREARFEN